jgi:ribosomal-protein-alanine N-acetyltransferase
MVYNGIEGVGALGCPVARATGSAGRGCSCAPNIRFLHSMFHLFLFIIASIYPMQTFIETERLLIREILPTDIEGMFEMDSDPEVHRYLGKQFLQTREESAQMNASIRQQYIDNGIGRWAMIEKKSGEFIGWTGLKFMTEPVNGHIHYYDLGYRLRQKYWGKGYASESAIAAVDYGFNQLKLKAIYAFADLGNHASIHILRKAGLECKETFDYKGVPHQWLEIQNPGK